MYRSQMVATHPVLLRHQPPVEAGCQIDLRALTYPLAAAEPVVVPMDRFERQMVQVLLDCLSKSRQSAIHH